MRFDTVYLRKYVSKNLHMAGDMSGRVVSRFALTLGLTKYRYVWGADRIKTHRPNDERKRYKKNGVLFNSLMSAIFIAVFLRPMTLVDLELMIVGTESWNAN